MSSRKSNKFFDSEVEQVVEALVEDAVTTLENLPEPEVIEESPVIDEPVVESDSDPVVTEIIETDEPIETVPSDVDPERAEAERLNRVNDLEKQIIQHQESIKQLRSELKKLDGKTKREGPTKMEMCVEIWKANPGLTRKEYVQMFQDKCGLTVAGSRTYAQLIISKNK